MKRRIEGRKNYPTDEVDPENFYDDNKIRELEKSQENFKFTQEDFKKLYNCVHCGECETEMRIQLKQKFLEDGNTVEGLKEMKECFDKFRTPYPTNKMRIKRHEGIEEKSDTLYFMGCLSTIRIPKYTNNSIEYLLKQGIDFTILDTEICCGWPWFASGSLEEFEKCKKENIEIFKNYKKIICLCPACFYLFESYYKSDMSSNTEFIYIADYLRPAEAKKSGKVSIQHLCQLMNRGREGVDKRINDILGKSGYEVIDIPHWCCGGGIGYSMRTDVIDKIARKRMEDFDRKDVDYITTYCVSCWWILRRFSKQCKIHPEAKSIFELLS